MFFMVCLTVNKIFFYKDMALIKGSIYYYDHDFPYISAIRKEILRSLLLVGHVHIGRLDD